MVYLAQHTYSSNIYCRMFLYQLFGEIPMATFLYHRLHFRSLRAIFEAQDPNAIHQVELTETLAAAKKQLKYLSDYDIKVLTEAAQFKSIMNAGGGLARHKSIAGGAGPLSSSNQSSAALNPKLGVPGSGATSAKTLPGISRQRLVVQLGLASADSQWTTDGVRSFIATCLQKRMEDLGLFNLDSADPPDLPQLSLLAVVPEAVVDTVASAGSAGGGGGNPQGSRNQKPVVAQAASSAHLKGTRKKSKA